MKYHAAKNGVTTLCVLALIAFTGSQASAGAKGVNCDKGDSIQTALDSAKPGDTLNVSGSCVENITITKDGIQLIGPAGASITAGDAAADVVTILGRQVVVRGFTITGGRIGIRVAEGGSAVIGGPDPGHKNVVEHNASNGIAIDLGGFARVEGNDVQNNGTDKAANGSHGITVFRNASADIFDNTITNNVRRGITVGGASAARIGGNIIIHNGYNTGTDPGQGIRSGIGVVEHGHVDLVGENTIEDNARNGFRCTSFSTAEVKAIQAFSNNADGDVSISLSRCAVVNKAGDPKF